VEEGAAVSTADGGSEAAAAGDAAGICWWLLLLLLLQTLVRDPARFPRPDVREGFATRGFGSGSAQSKQQMYSTVRICLLW